MTSKKALSATATDALLKIEGLSIPEVERLASAAYRARGFQVRALQAGDAQGSDLLLTREAQALLLQCKYWKTRKVGEMPVRELYGTMAAHSATGGVLISLGNFTLEASRFAGLGGIELLDGTKFRALLHGGGTEQEAAAAAHSMAG